MNPVTPEGVEVKVGQKWRDLDKRTMGGRRVCEVVGFDMPDNPKVAFMRNIAMPHLKATRVQIRRMKKGSTGWALVE